MIAARGDERRLVAVALLQLEAEHVAPERKRAVDVRHLQMHMTDVDAGIDGGGAVRGAGVHLGASLPPSHSSAVAPLRALSRPCFRRVQPLRHEPERMATPDATTAQDTRVDPDVHAVVLRCRAQDAGVLWEVALGERRHHAARARAGYAQTHVAADRELASDPLVLDEAALAGGRLDNDVGAEPVDLEAAGRVESRAGGRSSPLSERGRLRNRRMCRAASPRR